MKRTNFPIKFFVAFSLLTGTVQAIQTPNAQAKEGASGTTGAGRPPKTDTKSSGASLNEQMAQQFYLRALDALRAVAEDAKEWKDSSAAAHAQAQVADLTWEADTGAARGYLLRGWEVAGRVEEAREERSRYRNASARTEARRVVLLVARKRAPELAQKWLEQIAEESEGEQGKGQRGAFDDRTPRSAALLQMAMASVAESPQAAAELAIESLRDGVSFGFQSVLLALQEKDFNLSQSVFRAALTRLKSVGILDPNELLILGAYLYTPGRVVGANTTENRGSFPMTVARNRPRVTAAAELNPAMALEFLDIAADILVNTPLPSTTANPREAARAQVSAIGFLIGMGRMSERLPERAAALRRRAQLIEADAQFSYKPVEPRADTPAPLSGEGTERYAERRIDALEEIARNEAAPLARNIAYARAALATEPKDYERGWRLAGNIRDDLLREGVTDWLTYRGALHFAGAGDFDKTYELSKKTNDPAYRAASLVVGAQKLSKAKETARAAQWLQEARALVKAARTDGPWSRIAFGIASTYARFDPAAALEALADGVKLMNQTLTAPTSDEKAPVVKRFSGLTAQDFSYGTSGFGLKAAVAMFGPDQFENVLGTLKGITSPEARGVAIVTLGTTILQASKRNARAKS